MASEVFFRRSAVSLLSKDIKARVIVVGAASRQTTQVSGASYFKALSLRKHIKERIDQIK